MGAGLKRAFAAAKATRRPKYGNKKCEWRGEKFDSQKELKRHLVLLDMQKRGEIFGIERQPRVALFVNGKKICDYVGDWRYQKRIKDGLALVVEDAKGFQTRDFKLKWKLCQALYPEITWRLS